MTVTLPRKCEHGAVAFFLYARRYEPYDSLVPRLVVNTHARRPLLRIKRIDVSKCLFAHRRLNLTTLLVDVIKQGCELRGSRIIVGQQTLYANGHVLETTRGIEAWTGRKTEIGADDSR